MVAAMQEAVKARPQRVVQVPTLTMGTVQEQQKAIQVISLALHGWTCCFYVCVWYS
jgi:hypothetical protein